jgi:hypothetical protein
MSLPEYPITEDGRRDHFSAIEEMFLHPPTRARPQHVKIDGTHMTFVDTSANGDELYWQFSLDFTDNTTRAVSTVEVWHDWVHGPLMPVRIEFLAADQSVYNKEEQAVVPISEVQ